MHASFAPFVERGVLPRDSVGREGGIVPAPDSGHNFYSNLYAYFADTSQHNGLGGAFTNMGPHDHATQQDLKH